MMRIFDQYKLQCNSGLITWPQEPDGTASSNSRSVGGTVSQQMNVTDVNDQCPRNQKPNYEN